VVSTAPANGATDVDIDLQTVSIQFSEPMSAAYGIISTNFPSYTTAWSGGNTVLTITKVNSTTMLQANYTYSFTLNPSGYEDWHYRNTQGAILPQTTFTFSVIRTDYTPPQVISTTPVDGATNVSRDLQTITIRFSESMSIQTAITSSNYRPYTISWTENNTVLNLTRNDLLNKLNTGLVYSFVLNPSGTASGGFHDLQGNLLPETTFSFTVGEDLYDCLKVERNTVMGFHWDYFLVIPKKLRKRTVLLVEPNNSGLVSDDIAFHEQKALGTARLRAGFAIDLDVPLLVPVFPRPEAPDLLGTYTHALDENTLRATAYIDGKSIARLDLQLIAMIVDARERLKSRGHIVSEKVFMMGFSASGAFTSRFTAIHPDIIMAAAPGSPGGWPIAPVTTWEGIQYRYPIGVSNFQAITGKPFDLATFRKVPQFIYVGEVDRNDAFDLRGFPEEDAMAVCNLLNCEENTLIAERWPVAEEIYASINSVAEFRVYPGVAHAITDQMYSDIMAFFKKHDKTRKGNTAVIQLLLDD
jgi:hypothetical protein